MSTMPQKPADAAAEQASAALTQTDRKRVAAENLRSVRKDKQEKDLRDALVEARAAGVTWRDMASISGWSQGAIRLHLHAAGVIAVVAPDSADDDITSLG
jgi:hypothetical protein